MFIVDCAAMSIGIQVVFLCVAIDFFWIYSQGHMGHMVDDFSFHFLSTLQLTSTVAAQTTIPQEVSGVPFSPHPC